MLSFFALLIGGSKRKRGRSDLASTAPFDRPFTEVQEFKSSKVQEFKCSIFKGFDRSSKVQKLKVERVKRMEDWMGER